MNNSLNLNFKGGVDQAERSPESRKPVVFSSALANCKNQMPAESPLKKIRGARSPATASKLNTSIGGSGVKLVKKDSTNDDTLSCNRSTTTTGGGLASKIG